MHRRFERRLDTVLADAEADDALDLLAIACRFLHFPREGLDRRQHAEVFFRHADGGGMFFLQLAGQRAQLAPDDLEQQIENRNRCGDRQPQQRIGAQHDQHRAHHRQQERDQAQQCAGDVTGKLGRFVGQQRQDVPAAALVIEAERQGLQMVVNANAQIGQNPFAGDAHQVGIAESEERLTGEEHEQGEQYRPHVGLETGQQAPGETPAQPGNGQRHTGFGQHQEAGQRQLYTVRRREAEKKTQVHGGHGEPILPYSRSNPIFAMIDEAMGLVGQYFHGAGWRSVEGDQSPASEASCTAHHEKCTLI